MVANFLIAISHSFKGKVTMADFCHIQLSILEGTSSTHSRLPALPKIWQRRINYHKLLSVAKKITDNALNKPLAFIKNNQNRMYKNKQTQRKTKESNKKISINQPFFHSYHTFVSPIQVPSATFYL